MIKCRHARRRSHTSEPLLSMSEILVWRFSNLRPNLKSCIPKISKPQPNHTHRFCQGMLGCGRANVSEICDLARANIKDGLPSAALEAFSSLGTGGRHAANQERDLHKWLHSLWGVKLTVYKVTMNLIVSGQYILYMWTLFSVFFLQIKNIIVSNIFEQLRLTSRRWRSQSMCLSYCHMRFFTRFMKLDHCRLEPQTWVRGTKENIFCIDFTKIFQLFWKIVFPWTLQFARSMTGHRSSESISHFWKHCCSLDEWRNHPCLTNPDLYHCVVVHICCIMFKSYNVLVWLSDCSKEHCFWLAKGL